MSTRLIIIVIMIAAALVLGIALVWPKYQSFQLTLAELKQKETELSSKTAYYSKIKETWSKLESYNDVLPEIDSALPKTYSAPALFNYLDQTAGESGLVLDNLTFEGAAGEKVKEISLKLHGLGAYSSLKSFLFSLESSVRFFQVKSISFSSKEKGTVDLNLEITTYSY